MSRSFSRTPQACGTCRRRKTKCDGVRPRCGHCASKNLACVWSGPNASYETLPLTPDLSDTFEDVGGSPLASIGKHSTRGLQICLDLFFDRHFANDFCSFDYQPDFERKCRQYTVLSSSIIALCGRYLKPQDAQDVFGLASGHEVSKHYVNRARSLAKATSDEPSVTHIQSNLILAMAELLFNSGSRHWLFTGVAIRMAEIMRLNKEFHQKHSLRDQEIRRRTFWACLLLDRMLANLLAKHRTVDLENIAIAVPGTDAALAYQEETRGISLSDLSTNRRPSDLGLSSYLIKIVCLWSDLADFAVYSRRRLDVYPPTDPRSTLFIRFDALQKWLGSLPPGLCWSNKNYEDHCALNRGKTFIAMQFLTYSASCVAHQCYLPHYALYTKPIDLVDAAGLSYLHRDESLIETCVSNALKLGEVLAYVMDQEQGCDQSSLQTVWVASSVLITANTFLWLQYTHHDTYPSEIQTKAKYYFDLVHQLVSSWVHEWKSAKQWLVALNIMHDLYKAAYLGEVNEKILSPHDSESSHSDDDSAGEFRPQPGDGYPPLVNLPHLQASVKFATCDTSAKSINVQSIWQQLSSGWPHGFAGSGYLMGSVVEAYMDTDGVNTSMSMEP